LINQRGKLTENVIAKIDRIDNEIIALLLVGKNNKQISTKIKIPLSTVQRRVRRLIADDLITFNSQINFEKFGFKVGMLHIYLLDGDFVKIAEKLKEFGGITSVEVHIGNSDLIAHVVYKHSMDLLELIGKVKSLEKIEKIVWSERIYKIRSDNPPILPDQMR
jgi:DNA-binding Lrp family transcriptional regulator